MKQVIFDFENIRTMDDFYKEVAGELLLPDYFGNNLDALYDCLTGDTELPLEICFINLAVEQLEVFDALIRLLEELSDELPDEFFFEYFLRKE